MPIVGIEPSAILTFRDEYPRLVKESLLNEAQAIAKQVFTIDEFLLHEYESGHISSSAFGNGNGQKYIYHEHCHQKSILGRSNITMLLEIIPNIVVQKIDSGCCGMSGSFGYEKEHFDISKAIFNSKLSPIIEKSNSIVIANGTSCRHQIFDFQNIKAHHIIEILYDHLKIKTFEI